MQNEIQANNAKMGEATILNEPFHASPQLHCGQLMPLLGSITFGPGARVTREYSRSGGNPQRVIGKF